MDPMTIATLAKVGGEIASQLFNKPKVRSPRETILSTVQGAREAGIHPLAALGASPQYQTVSGGVSTGSAIAAGVSSLGQAAGESLAGGSQEKLLAASTEAQLAQAELFRAQSRSLIAGAASAAIGGPDLTWDPRLPETASPMKLFGQDFVPRDGDPPAQRAQDWYGELGEMIQGLSNFMRSNPGSLPTDDFDKKVYSWMKRGPSNFGPSP